MYGVKDLVDTQISKVKNYALCLRCMQKVARSYEQGVEASPQLFGGRLLPDMLLPNPSFLMGEAMNYRRVSLLYF